MHDSKNSLIIVIFSDILIGKYPVLIERAWMIDFYFLRKTNLINKRD